MIILFKGKIASHETRRSSRNQGTERKKWWHLLRAAPDAYIQDSGWDSEPQHGTRRRKANGVKRNLF